MHADDGNADLYLVGDGIGSHFRLNAEILAADSVSSLAKRLGLPVFPITPTFPWLGPLGLLPYPVSYEIVYGEPLKFYESYGREDARDPELVRALSRQVRSEVQRLIDLHR